MRTPTEALKEIRDRLTYFCLRTDGRYDPPWVTEIVGIIDEAVTDSHAINNVAAMRGNAAAMREVLMRFLIWAQQDLWENACEGTNHRQLVNAIVNEVSAALAEPARNCDRPECATSKAAQDVWRKEDGGKTPYYEWLFAPAAERKGDGDGR